MIKKNGFTLVEMLISFAYLLLIVSFIPIIMTIIKETHNETLALTNIEWEIFVSQLTFEYREAQDVRVDPSTLTFITFDHKQVTYERYQDKVRRRVNKLGHEVLLQKIDQIKYKQTDNLLHVEVIDQKQNKYRSKISKFDE
ncbi:competence type IV pilus minor pilin ComGF [Bacillus sp. CGMCC 1.16541]|uniref:competence type IV pilus minor pilin ComGF n=1 Tax=Bacillus sp. CGMCC 1.16541 TaxID=2185143 RepID=UPI000D73F80E|nr:competence type IV pilus minor pilin ComGF [Bacillus sp. CGMCC 1.16541]